MKINNTALALMLGMTTLLAACGGGGDGSTSAAASPLSVSGTAAVGAPIVGGTVTLKCATGASVTAQTAANGTWSAKIPANALPCSVQVKGGTANGQALPAPLHSVVQAAGNVNITPLTELIVAALADKNPATWFDELSSNGDTKLSSAITADALKAAGDVLKTALASLPGKPTLPAGFDPLISSFSATAGDPADDLLESYSQSLELAGLSPADAVNTVVIGGSALTLDSSTGTTYTTPNITSFPFALSQNLDGNRTLTFLDPNRGKKTVTVTGVNADGNITNVQTSEFSGFVSLLGNRVGMLCVASSGNTNVAQWSQYVHISSEMTEVTNTSELQGKIFTEYENCVATGTSEFLADGSFLFTEYGGVSDAVDPNIITQAFSAAGYEEQENGGIAVQRAKAFKYTSNGVTKYVYITVSTKKGSTTPEVNGDTDYVLFGVSN